MASFNGAAWIGEQLQSILAQTGVALEVFISDDGSTDATQAVVAALAGTDARIHWSLHAHPQGHAAANFFHLVRTVDVSAFDFIAFADQDDVWLPSKLLRQVAQIVENGADGVSSDVIAYWASGRAHYLRKSTPQRDYDYLFESPGPGCSMLITPRLHARLREVLDDDASPAQAVGYHDWLVYAVARASGWAWHIGSEPTLLYRQHEANELGVNKGLLAWVLRARRYAQGRFTRDCRAVLSVAAECARQEGRPMADLSVWDILLQGRRTAWHRGVVALMFPRGLRRLPDAATSGPPPRPRG